MGTRITKYHKNNRKRAKMIASGDPGDAGNPGDVVHGLQLGTSPARAGGQDDVSLNKLPQISMVQQLLVQRGCLL